MELLKADGTPYKAEDIQSTSVQTRSTSIPNLDPEFFWSTARRNQLTLGDIEEKPYQFHWLIFTLASIIAQNISGSLKKRLRRTSDGEWIDKHEVMEVLKRPNQFMTITNLFEAIVLYLLLPARSSTFRDCKGGQVFLICTKATKPVDLRKGEIPDYIFPYSDEYVEPILDAGYFKGWKLCLTGNDADAIQFLPWEVIRINRFNPYNILSGLSPYFPQVTTLTADLNSELWNAKLYENDATPAGVLSSEQPIPPEMRREMQNEWYQQYGGPMNARRIAILSGGLKYQTVSITPKDMEWTAQKQRADQILTSVFGLNKIARGDIETINRATLEEGRRILWEDTYLPIDSRICEAINTQWINNIGKQGEIELASDTSGVRALREDHTGKSTAVKDYVAVGMPVSLACRLCDVPLNEEDLSEYPWLDEKPEIADPFGLSSASSGDDEEDGGADSEKKEPGDSPSKNTKSFKGRAYTLDELDKISATYIERVLEPGERTMLRALLAYFNEQKNTMLDKVDDWAGAGKGSGEKKVSNIITKGDMRYLEVGMFTLDVEEETERLRKLLIPLFKNQMKRERAKVKEEIASVINWDVTDEKAIKYATKRKADLKRINKLTFKKVSDGVAEVVKEAVDDGMNVQQVAKRVKEVISEVGEYAKNHAKTIARTETAIVSSQSRAEMFKEVGIEYVQWSNSQDEKVRVSHSDMPEGDGGVVVRFGKERFPRTGMMHPHDPSGPPGEIINCRCSIVAVSGQEGE